MKVLPKRAFPKLHTFHSALNSPESILTLKPNEFHLSCIIYKVATNRFGFAKFDCFNVDNFTNNLNFGNVVLQFINFVIPCAVNVSVWKKFNKSTYL
jgi:hypothetical protein